MICKHNTLFLSEIHFHTKTGCKWLSKKTKILPQTIYDYIIRVHMHSYRIQSFEGRSAHHDQTAEISTTLFYHWSSLHFQHCECLWMFSFVFHCSVILRKTFLCPKAIHGKTKMENSDISFYALTDLSDLKCEPSCPVLLINKTTTKTTHRVSWMVFVKN